MKKAILFLCFVPALCMAQPAQLLLSPPVIVAGGSTYNSTKPRITLVRDSIPVISWGKPAPNGKVFVSKWNGTAFTTPLQVTPSGISTYTNANDGPNIAGRGDTVYVTFFSMSGVITKAYVVRSFDAGNTFSDTVRVDHQYPSTNKYAYSPFVAVGAGGNPYMTFEISTSTLGLPEQMVNYSTDGGATFTNEVNANSAGPGEPCECCPPALVLKDSLVFMLYRNNDNNVRDIYCGISTDYGNSFNTSVRMDFNNWVIFGWPSQGAEGYLWNDSLVGVWMSDPGNFARINIGTLHTSTFQAGPNRYVDTIPGSYVQRHPSIAGNGDTIGIAWDDNRDGNTNCYLSVSLSGTSGFSNTVVINDTLITGHQTTPHIAYHNGVFHITYRDDANNNVMYRKAAVVGALGTPEMPDKDNYSLYPNPFRDQFSIKGFKGSAKVYNCLGELVHQCTDCPANYQLPGLPAGIYFVHLLTEKGTVVLKAVKQ